MCTTKNPLAKNSSLVHYHEQGKQRRRKTHCLSHTIPSPKGSDGLRRSNATAHALQALQRGPSRHPSHPQRANLRVRLPLPQLDPTKLILIWIEKSPCYRRFVNVKTVKRLEALAKGIGAAPTQTKRVLVGLSLGPSSTALVDVLNDCVQSQLRKRPSPAFDPVVVHVDDTDLLLSHDSSASPASAPMTTTTTATSTSLLLQRFRERYPRFRFVRVPLADVLALSSSVDWSSLPVALPPPRARAEEAEETAEQRLRAFLANLPSTTSRADVRRLLVRHVLLACARREGCRALLLGASTTALAELTLGETAKGRGFSLPGLINDGAVAVVPGKKQQQQPQEEQAPRRKEETTTTGDDQETQQQQQAEEASGPPGNNSSSSSSSSSIPVYYPNRELFRGELQQYTTLTEPPLTDLLLLPSSPAPAAVVSHKDVSIDEVMARYFAEVEANYPSIVANVVRTTAKLERAAVTHHHHDDDEEEEEEEYYCGLCGMGLDELGDERWKGEIGDVGCGEDRTLCYGCSRAMRG